MARVAKIFATGLAFLLLLVVLIFAVLLSTPHLLVNDSSIGTLSKWVLGKENISWQTLKVQVEPLGLSSKELHLEVRDLRYDNGTNQVKTPLLRLSLVFDLFSPELLPKVIGPVTVKELFLNLQDQGGKKKKEKPLDLEKIIKLVERLHLKEISLGIAGFSYQKDGKMMQAKGSIHLSGYGHSAQDSLRINLYNAHGLGFKSLHTRLNLSNYESLWDRRAHIAVQANLGLAEGSVRATWDLAPETKGVRTLTLSSGILLPAYAGNAVMAATIADRELRGTLKLKADRISHYFVGSSLNPCNIKLSWGSDLNDAVDLRYSCDGHTHRTSFTRDRLESVILPAKVDFVLSGEAQLREAGSNPLLVTDTRLDLDELKRYPLELSGQAKLKGQIPLDRFKASRLALSLDFKAAIVEFAKLVELLEPTRWAIPAPFNQLRGRTLCSITGHFQGLGEAAQVPFRCKLDLPGKRTSLVGGLHGKFSLATKGQSSHRSLNLNIILDDVGITLPDLKIGQPLPTLTTDKRIHRRPLSSEEREHSSFRYQITVKTATNAIKLHSNLIKEVIPLTVNATFSSGKPVRGWVRIADFTAEVLRRKAIVEQLRITLAAKQKNQAIRGKVRIKNPDYKINVTIAGTVAKPVYVFDSTPPLSDDEILGIILFGKEPDFLDYDKQRSVDETKAALADGAINLLSMYYLASTPVESIGYNPATEMFTARLRLAKGFSLTLGTDRDDDLVGFRRRLGGRWMVETKAIHDRESETTTGAAVLKWGLRY